MPTETAHTLLLHVGFPKAGSTWLQRSLFTKPQTGFCSPWGEQAPQLIEHVRVTDTFIFDEKLEDLRKSYEVGFSEAHRNGLTPVLSFEHLLVDPMGGSVDRREGVRRLRDLFPDAKILLVIREQKSIILSAYLEHLRRGFPTKLDRFMGFDDLRQPGFGCSCPLDLFLYDRLITYLHENFGRENTLILPLEMMGKTQFLEALYDFMGMSVEGRTLPAMANKERQARKSDLVFLRRLNYIGMSRYASKGKDSLLRKAAYGLNLALNPLTPEKLANSNRQKLKDQIQGYVGSYFEDSNQRTAEILGIDLAAYGYSTPKDEPAPGSLAGKV
ncbi:MAG: hypothetical protein JXJ18_10255 [Rhodobacteraceae bacterium]|nr:hypothetical protein [Paracoccaceae bacterium]